MPQSRETGFVPPESSEGAVEVSVDHNDTELVEFDSMRAVEVLSFPEKDVTLAELHEFESVFMGKYDSQVKELKRLYGISESERIFVDQDSSYPPNTPENHWKIIRLDELQDSVRTYFSLAQSHLRRIEGSEHAPPLSKRDVAYYTGITRHILQKLEHQHLVAEQHYIELVHDEDTEVGGKLYEDFVSSVAATAEHRRHKLEHDRLQIALHEDSLSDHLSVVQDYRQRVEGNVSVLEYAQDHGYGAAELFSTRDIVKHMAEYQVALVSQLQEAQLKSIVHEYGVEGLMSFYGDALHSDSRFKELIQSEEYSQIVQDQREKIIAAKQEFDAQIDARTEKIEKLMALRSSVDIVLGDLADSSVVEQEVHEDAGLFSRLYGVLQKKILSKRQDELSISLLQRSRQQAGYGEVVRNLEAHGLDMGRSGDLLVRGSLSSSEALHVVEAFRSARNSLDSQVSEETAQMDAFIASIVS